ncbi:hypothetical protein [Salicibibacter kimchii]|uniref:Uncharacterized protein n=1 Tax=Salicibibacter kimchii TaxID=2099786 RepID=A0A345C2Z3_9BACI|nr:hypothetical protein [Salicibibacter kimchii]AXF57574.1 hypothetical protein DT065_17335 [Salicibibacter kimchii]
MRLTNSTENYRGIIAAISPSMTNNVDITNPSVVAWWSAAYPGFGHFILGNYFIGFVLLVHEVLINILSGLNLAIYYSFTGKFEQAIQSVDTNWFLAYFPIYFFAIWNSYQRTRVQNEDYVIARQIGYDIYSKSMSMYSFNRLEEKKPSIAVFWSMLAPGLGHIYINRLLILLLVPLLVLIMYMSQALPALQYTMVGNFDAARNVTNPQWLMNLPSFYGFFVYDAYLKTVEYNDVYKLYQRLHLEKTYQHEQFQLPV